VSATVQPPLLTPSSSSSSSAKQDAPPTPDAASPETTAPRPLPSNARLIEPFRGSKGHELVAMTNGVDHAFADYGSSPAVSPDKPVLVASFTKLWTAVAALRLIERKEMSLDETIRDVLPDLASRPWADSTLRELMSHTSRVPEFDDKSGFYRASVDYSESPAAVLAKNVPKDWTEKRGVYKYRNAEFAIVGAMLAAHAKIPTDQVLAREVFEPAKMKHAGLLVGKGAPPDDLDLSPMGGVRPHNFFTAGAGYASIADLLSFFDALSNNTTLINDASKKMLFTGAKEHGFISFGCWAYPFGSTKPALLVERPGSFGNIRLLTAYFPEEHRAIVAWNSDGVEIARPRTGEQGIGARLSRIALE
jgi:CubicO group peptidase (beta-lactamase class C family)